MMIRGRRAGVRGRRRAVPGGAGPVFLHRRGRRRVLLRV